MHPLVVPSLLFLLLAPSGCKKGETTSAPVPVKSAPPAEAPKAASPGRSNGRVVELAVTEDGFVPANVTLKANEPVTFRVTRRTDDTCARDFLIEGTDVHLALPLDETVEVAWTPTKAGRVKFGCAMDMMVGGVLLVE